MLDAAAQPVRRRRRPACPNPVVPTPCASRAIPRSRPRMASLGPLEGKDALLLAYVAIEGPTSRRVLAGLLWPDVDAERARANLRQRLFRLRKVLGRDLLAGGETACLCADLDVDLDVPGADAGALLQGIDAEAAGGLADWLDAARERRRVAQRRAVAATCAQLEAAGDLGPALDAAQQLVGLDPTSEHAHRGVMRLHYLRGDRAAALAAFDRCCDVLEQALGVAPDAETEALRARVASASLLADAAQGKALPLTVLRPPRLIGRDAEWQALGENWEAGTVSLVAGDAGLGKSRLLADFAGSRVGCLAVAARPGDDRVPHSLLSRLLRRLLAQARQPVDVAVAGELATLLPELGRARPHRDGNDRMRFVDAVELLLRQAHGEGLAGLAVDDLQFADAASIEVLQHLAAAEIGLPGPSRFGPPSWRRSAGPSRRVPARRRRPPAGAAAARAGAGRRPARLARRRRSRRGAARAGAGASHRGQSDVRSRDAEAAACVVGPPPREPPGRRRRSAAVRVATARAAVALPAAANVRRVIEQRIGGLSAGAVRLARCAALAGPDFSAALAAQVLGLRAIDLADAWAELESAHVLRESVFAHDLIFEAARDSVPTPSHASSTPRSPPSSRRRGPSRHGSRSTGSTPAIRCGRCPGLVAAADRAPRRLASGRGGGSPSPGGTIIRDSGSEPVAAFALLKRAHRAHLQSNLGSAAHLEVIDALDAIALLPIESAYASFARADTLAQRGDGGLAERMHGPGSPSSTAPAASPPTRWRSISPRRSPTRCSCSTDRRRAPTRFAPSSRRLLTLNDRQREIEHYANLGVLLDAGNRHVEAQPALRHVLALTRAHGDRTSEMMTLSNLASSLYDVGQVPAALETLHTAYRLKEAYPELRTSSLFLEAQLGNAHRALGHYGEALAWQQRALPILAEYVPAFVAAAHNGLARIWLDLGQFARAGQHLQQALGRHPVPAWSQATSHLLCARLAFEQSHGDAAAKAIGRAEAIGATRFAVRARRACSPADSTTADAAYRDATSVALEAGRLQVHGVRIDALTLPRGWRAGVTSQSSPRRTRSRRFLLSGASTGRPLPR